MNRVKEFPHPLQRILLFFGVFTLSLLTSGNAAPLMVTSTEDSGPGSLREQLNAPPTCFSPGPVDVAIYDGPGNSMSTVDPRISAGPPDATSSVARLDFFGGPSQRFSVNNSPNIPGGPSTYAIVVTGVLRIDSAGTYTFGSYSDDNSRIRIDLDQDGVLEGNLTSAGGTEAGGGGTVLYQSGCCHHELGAAVPLAAGEYRFEAVYTEGGGGDYGEFYYTPGDYSSYNNASGAVAFDDAVGAGAAFVLLGDPSRGITTGTYKSRILFDPALNGETIILTNGQLTVDADTEIDATGLPSGITVSGNHSDRVFRVESGTDVNMAGFTITGGDAGTGNGGGILNLGNLTLDGMTLRDNMAVLGGGVYSLGDVAVINSTVAANLAVTGGGLLADGPSLTLIHATVAGNSASSNGAGIAVGTMTSATFENIIVADNTAPLSPDIDELAGSSNIQVVGVNIIGDLDGSGLSTNSPSVLVADPMLGPLQDNGGPTHTMAVGPGSPALDTALGAIQEQDQRGASRVSLPGTGVYAFQADGTNLDVYVEYDGTHSWLLVGRGREGWAWDDTGKGSPGAVKEDLGTPAAFDPSYYSSAIIDDLLAQAGTDLTQVEIRLKRAANTNGTSYQEVRWRPITQSTWTWDGLEAGSGQTGYAIEHEILAGTPGGPFFDPTSQSADTWRTVGSDSGNNLTRVFTWPWSSHGGIRGFSYGSTVTDGVNNSTSFLWQNANENHAIPYTEVYIRAEDLTGLMAGAFGVSSVPDVGAYEYVSPVISNATDSIDASLRNAIAYSAPGTPITFDPSLNGQTLAITAFSIEQDVVLDASGLPDGLTFSGGGQARVLEIAGADVTLDGFTITGGQAESGGGIHVASDGVLTLRNMTVAGNHADRNGGGIHNEGVLRMENCTLAGNGAGFLGGAIFNERGRTEINHCTISDNQAPPGSGGGVASTGDSAANPDEVVQVLNSVIAGNAGGDVHNYCPATPIHRWSFGESGGAGTMLVDSIGGQTGTIVNVGGNDGTVDAGQVTLAGGAHEDADYVRLGPSDSELLGGVSNLTLETWVTHNAVFVQPPDPLRDALDQPGLRILSGSDWFSQSATTHDGTDAAESRDIGNNEQSRLRVQVTGPDDLLFEWKVSSEANYDFLRLILDGVLQDQIHGAVGWVAKHLAIPAGAHTVEWVYTKDGSLSEGADAGFVDEVRLASSAPSMSRVFSFGGNDDGTDNGSNAFFLGWTQAGGASTQRLLHQGSPAFDSSTMIPLGEEVHIAVTWSAADQRYEWYLDGMLVGGSTAAGGPGLVNDNNLWLGRSQWGGFGTANASWNEFRIYDQNLTANDFAANISAGPDATCSATFMSAGFNLIGVGNATGAFHAASDATGHVDPFLAPLGDYGGPTETMPPLPGSPAIHAALPGLALDQRGIVRDANPDIGAVEFVSVVGTTAEDGPDSLRSLLRLVSPGTRITFDPLLDDGLITLTNSELAVTKDLAVDATGLPGGIVVSGNQTSRVFRVDAGNHVVLSWFTIAGGLADDGGGVWNGGDLVLSNMTVSGNSATNGAGVYSAVGSSLLVHNTTLAENIATADGGGIWNAGTLTLHHATVSANEAGNQGGGLWSQGSTLLIHSIIAGNTAADDPDLHEPTLTEQGTNVVGNAHPLLAPLGSYGGPTHTMALLPGSPAIDGGMSFSNSPAIDQRGFSRSLGGTAPDIGAYEARNERVVNAADSGSGSLRNAIATADQVRFDTNVFVAGGTLDLTSSLVVSNQALWVDASGLPDGVVVSGSDLDRVFDIAAGSVVTLERFTIAHGDAGTEAGGGIRNLGDLTLNQMTISGNAAGQGGGVFSEGILRLENSTVAENMATGEGGGLYTKASHLWMNQVTISGNHATRGGGVAVVDSNASATVINSIIAGNMVSSGSESNGADVLNEDAAIDPVGGNLIGNNSSVGASFPPGPTVGTPASPLDPQLEPLADNGGATFTMEVPVGSPALDAGWFDPAISPVVDQRGESRLLGGRLDLGAFERNSITPTGGDFASGYGTNAVSNAVLLVSTEPGFSNVFTSGLIAGISTNGFRDGVGANALFSTPHGIAVASNGNLMVADLGNNRIRRIQNDGLVDTLAGSGVYGFADGDPGIAQFAFPLGVAVEADGTVYVADSENHRIRTITPDGEVATLAGSGTEGNVGGPGPGARFYSPAGVVVDAFGTVYVADSENHSIRKVTPAGFVSTVAGSGLAGSADGSGAAAQFNTPTGLAFGPDGHLYVADRDNGLIRHVTLSGVVTTVPMTGFSLPSGVAVDAFGNIFVADRGLHQILEIPADTNTLLVVAGNGVPGYAEGTGTNAQFNTPTDVVVDSAGDLYVADAGNHRVRKLTGSLRTFPSLIDAGDHIAEVRFLEPGTPYYYKWAPEPNRGSFTTGDPEIEVFDGADTNGLVLASGDSIQFASDRHSPSVATAPRTLTVANQGNFTLTLSGLDVPVGYTTAGFSPGPLQPGETIQVDVWFEAATPGIYAGDLVIANDDRDEASFRLALSNRVMAPPQVTTLPADPLARFEATLNGAVDPVGSPTDAWFEYSTDPGLAPPLRVDTLAGSGSHGFADGTGANAAFGALGGGVVDATGTAFIADRLNHVIRKVTPDGSVTTLAGTGGSSGFSEGLGAAARFNQPTGIAMDGAGNLFVADSLNHRIRRITPAGLVSTYVGSGIAGFADGPGGAAEFLFPVGVVFDAAGNLLVADRGNHRIRSVGTNQVVSTLAGDGEPGLVDGLYANARFHSPQDLAMSPGGIIYVADRDNHSVRILSAGTVTTLAGSGIQGFLDGSGTNARFDEPSGIAVDTDGRVLVADQGNHRVRSITPGGEVSTLAGSGAEGGRDVPGTTGLLLPATMAEFSEPSALAVAPDGRVLVMEAGQPRIRIIGEDVLPVTPVMQVNPAPSGIGPTSEISVLITDTFVPDVVYYVHAVATNLGGQTKGEVLPFTLPQPEIAVFAGETADAPELQNGQMVPVDFGLAPTSGASASFAIVNQGGFPLNLSGIDVPAGWGASPLTTIPPGGTGILDVVRHPSSPGVYSGLVAIANDDADEPSFTFPVLITLVAPPASATLGHEALGNDSATLRVQANPNGAPTDVLIALSTNPGFDDSANVGTLLLSGGSNVLSRPSGVVVNPQGTLYVADANHHVIWQIAPDGTTDLLAGDGIAGALDGPVSGARFDAPAGLALDGDGNLLVADTGNHRIRSISSDGVVSTVAGFGSAGFTDGVAAAALFNQPTAVAVDAAGNVYVADTGNHRVRRITPAGIVGTVAGPGGVNAPTGVAVDGLGQVVVADRHRVLRVTSDGVVETLAGSATSGAADGAGTSAQFNAPGGLVVDPSGTIFLADAGNHSVRRIRSHGAVDTLAGAGDPGGSGTLDGPGSIARFHAPTAIALDGDGVLYLADTGNGRIRTLTPATTRFPLAPPPADPGLEGTQTVAFALDVTGLIPGAYYYYRAEASSVGGDSMGSVSNFLLDPPDVLTLPATSTTGNGTVLNGELAAEAGASEVFFEYTADANFGEPLSATPPQAVPPTLERYSVSAPITGLVPGTPYYFRAVAINPAGRTEGAILAFRTLQTEGRPEIAVFDSSDGTGPELQHDQAAPVDFGQVPARVSVLHSFSIVNQGTTPLNLSAITASAGYTPLYSASAIDPGAIGLFSVQFSAAAPGVYAGAVSIASDDADEPLLRFPVTTEVLDNTPSTSSVAVVTTLPVVSVDHAGATVNGEVIPNGPVDVFFEFGPDPALAGPLETTLSLALPNSSRAIRISAPLSLAPGTYFYRLVATNPSGRAEGEILQFSTLPMVITRAASGMTETAALLNAEVNPHGASVVVVFEFAMHPAGGAEPAWSQIPVPNPVGGFISVPVSVPVSGLVPGTRYDFRARATSPHGTHVGETRSFVYANVPARTIEAWRARQFGHPENAGPGRNDNDADGDGIPNWKEYVHALDPWVPSTMGLPAWLVDGEDLVLRYRRPTNPADLAFRMAATEDLETALWSAISIPETLLSADPEAEEIEVRIPSPSAEGPSLYFYRLEILPAFDLPASP